LAATVSLETNTLNQTFEVTVVLKHGGPLSTGPDPTHAALKVSVLGLNGPTVSLGFMSAG
jgi:hypothetical protein